MQIKRSLQFLCGMFLPLAMCAVPLHAGTASFITGDVPNENTPLSDTNNGITASFSSPADPGAFSTSNTFLTFGPQVLFDPGPAEDSNIALDIGFNITLDSITMDFGTDGGSGLFDLSAYLGGTLVGSTDSTGTVASSGFPEGTISFSGGDFDSVVLTAPDAPYFAVANIDVTGATTPEPSYTLIFPLLGIGLAIAILNRRRAAARN